jgi:hypothetical protein
MLNSRVWARKQPGETTQACSGCTGAEINEVRAILKIRIIQALSGNRERYSGNGERYHFL